MPPASLPGAFAIQLPAGAGQADAMIGFPDGNRILMPWNRWT